MILPAQKREKKESAGQCILVAGGAGFLGAAVCRLLVEQNCKVFCLDDLTNTKKENITDLLGNENFVFLEHDVSNSLPSNLPRFDYIFHLSGIEEYLAGRDLTLETLVQNSQGTKNLLDRARADDAKFLLASSLEVYFGILSSSNLRHYFSQGEKTYRHHAHHEAKRYAEALTVAYFEKFNVNARIVRVIDVYGPGMPLETGSTISKLLKEALEGDILFIPSDGLDPLFPTYVTDVVYGVFKAAFGDETNGGIFNLVNLEEVNVLNFAYALKDLLTKLKPGRDIRLEFNKAEPVFKFPVPRDELLKSQQLLGWKPRVSLEDGLKQTLEAFYLRQKFVEKPKIEYETIFPLPQIEKYETSKKENFFVKAKEVGNIFDFSRLSLRIRIPTLPKIHLNLGLRHFLLIATGLVLFNFLLLPLVLIFAGGYFGYQKIYSLKKNGANINGQILEKDLKKTIFYFQSARTSLDQLGWLFWIGRQTNTKEELENLFDAGIYVSLGVQSAKDASLKANDLAGKILDNGGTEGMQEIIDNVEINLRESSKFFGLAEAKLSGDKSSKIPIAGDTRWVIDEIEQAKRKTDLAILGLEILPDVIGLNNQRLYLTLFQNNSEIRPTGGFIGSYGTLYFSKGRLAEIKVDDVYNLDGQLKEQIEPPSPLKKYLNVSSLGLRDSNWDPDFGKSANAAKYFYTKVFPTSIDGIFAFDQIFIARLLDILGPVYLNDYKETITGQNLADRAQYHSEIGFKPGSTAKKDFLGEVAEKILEKLKDNKQEKNWYEIINNVYQSLEEKHILLNFTSEKNQLFVAYENWAGLLSDLPYDEESKTYLTDYVSIFEANVAANKSNRFLKREISVNPVIQRDGNIISALSILYKNNSPADTWPGGNYKSYVRIYLPKGSKLESFEIGQINNLGLVETATENDKEIFGFLNEVGVGESKKVVLKYRTPYSIKITDNAAVYELLIQKQPGIENEPLTVNVSYPLYLKPVSAVPDNGKPSEQNLLFNTNLTTDKKFQIKFSL